MIYFLGVRDAIDAYIKAESEKKKKKKNDGKKKKHKQKEGKDKKMKKREKSGHKKKDKVVKKTDGVTVTVTVTDGMKNKEKFKKDDSNEVVTWYCCGIFEISSDKGPKESYTVNL